MKKLIQLIFFAILPLVSYAQDYTGGGYSPYDEYGDERNSKRDSTSSRRKGSTAKPLHYTWKWAHGGVYKHIIDEDTLVNSFHISNPMFQKSQSNTYLAPFPSPYQSNIFILRNEEEATYYQNLLRVFLFKPEDALLFNSTTPYSSIGYTSAGSRGRNETSLNVMHVQNITPFWNAGFRYNLARSDGRYLYQGTKAYDVSFFSNYDKNAFAFEFFINQNNAHIKENGGVADRNTIKDTTDKTDNVLVNLEEGTQNNLKNFNFYLGTQLKIAKHAYSQIKDTVQKVIPRKTPALDSSNMPQFANSSDSSVIDSTKLQRTKPIMDTVQIVRYDTTWNYIAKLLLSVKVEDNYRTFNEQIVTSDFFDHSYISKAKSSDAFHDKICNLSSKIVFNEIPKFPYLPGVYGGVDLDMRYNRQRLWTDTTKQNTQDTISKFLTREYSSLYVTAGIFNVDTNAKLNYDANLRLCIAGEYAGNFKIDGYIQQQVSKNAFVRADALYSMEDVNPYWRYYAGNHDYWFNKNFKSVDKLKVEARYINNRLRTEIGASITNTNGYVWMDSTFNIRQETKPFSTYTAWAKQHFQVWKLHFVESVYLQKSMNEDVLSLPLVSVYSSNYIQFNPIKDVLTLNVGVDLTYDSKFYADNYRPSTMTFYNQRFEKQGNLLQSSVFIDAKLSRCNIFLKYEHFDYYIRGGGNYFSAYDYPTNPPLFRIGLKWRFYD